MSDIQQIVYLIRYVFGIPTEYSMTNSEMCRFLYYMLNERNPLLARALDCSTKCVTRCYFCDYDNANHNSLQHPQYDPLDAYYN